MSQQPQTDDPNDAGTPQTGGQQHPKDVTPAPATATGAATSGAATGMGIGMSGANAQGQPVVVVASGEGMAVAGGNEPSPLEMVGQPAKVMRIGNMIKQLLEEVRSAPLDEKGRARLAEVHERSLTELEEGLSPELVAELHRISLPFSDETPSDAELRIAQAQLVGWLEGLFHGIQTALVAQQMAAQQQIAQMRKALPGGPGVHLPGAGNGQPDQPNQPGNPQTGQYL